MNLVNDFLSKGPSRPSITGKGRPIIFVHGNASTREVWTDVVRHLEDAHCCITYDLRGHGDGRPPDDTISLDQLVEDLEELREALGYDRVALVGHSLGAFIVARYAERHPGRVDWISLMAMPAARTEDDKKTASDLLRKMKKKGVAQVLPVLSSSWYTESFTASHPDALEKRLNQVLAIDEAVFLRFYGLYSRIDVDESLPLISVPALILTGEHARGCGAEVAANVAGLMHDAWPVVFADMKNGILTEIPGKVAQRLHEFALGIRKN